MPQTEEVIIQTSDWQTGVYFISLSAGGKRLFTDKLIKTNYHIKHPKHEKDN